MKNLKHIKASALFLCLLMLLPMFASCSSKEPIYSYSDGTRVYELYGSFSRPGKIRVAENGETVWKKKVRVKSSVGQQDGGFGLEITDLNFDGLNDIKLDTSVSGEVRTNVCFLRNPTTGKYDYSEELSELCNVKPNPEQKAIFSFAHAYEETTDKKGSIPTYTWTDTTTAFVWKGGTLKPYRRISLTYDSLYNNYRMSVSDYSDEIHEFLDPDDTWLTEEQYKKSDFSFLYYFK